MEEDTHDTNEVENPTGEFVEVTTCPRSEFAAVIFHNIPETYPADADVECMYTLTADIYPSTRDYIGLYKVGWMSYRDYVYYEWAPWPVLYEVEKDIDSKVIFPAGKLPTEDGEFYQFCYVMKTGQIRGASMPFQFKRPSADDFVEEEDVEGDMLVIRSKTIVLEEKIKQAQDEKIKLIETQENLERERESLISKMTELNRKLASEQESTAYLTEQLKLSHDRILQLNKEEEDMILVQDQLQQKLQQITESKCDLESEVKALEGRIEEYKQIIKTLENQKDELTGKNKSLEQEKELYKSHVSSSESVVLNHQREVLELRTELESCKAELKVANVDFLAVKVALETEKSELQKRSSSSSADKARIEELQECLRNVEDKLATEENTKKMLSEEINAFVITQEKMSRSLEDSSLESDKLREQINRFELQTRSLNAVIDQLKSEKQELDKEFSVARKELADTEEKLSRLAAAEKEVASLQEQVSCLKAQGETKEATENANAAAHFALQKANVTLRERLEKLTKRCEELQAHNDVLLKKKKQQEEKSKDLLRERDDLRERIHMCSGEYKALFTKNRKLQKKVDKMDKFGVRSKSKDGSGDDLTQSTDSSVKPESPRKAAGKPNLITATLQNKLEMLTSDLEKKCAKKEKYKKLYLEEKERQEMLRKHYYAESRKAEEDMEKLRRKNNNMKEEFDLKYRSMQNLLSKREKELDEVSRSRREVVGLLQEKERPSSSPKKEDRVVTTPPLPVLLYPNPYEGVASETVVYPPQRTDIHPLANPYHQLSSTIRYPTETIPESSASCPEQPLPVVMDRSDSVHVEIDRMSESEASGPLDPPLVPRGCLDPPLLPTITPTAKVAAVRSAIQPDGPQCVNDDFVLTLESSMEGETIEKVPITPTVVPSAPHDVADVEEEKYQDADGEAMKICPSCNEAFPHDVNEREFELHIVGHFGKICPLCDAQLEANCSTEDFEKHVNGHFAD